MRLPISLLLFPRYNDLIVKNLHFRRFYPPHSRLKPLQEGCPRTQDTKIGKKFLGYRLGENRTILRLIVLTHYQRVTDGRTDRQTDRSPIPVALQRPSDTKRRFQATVQHPGWTISKTNAMRQERVFFVVTSTESVDRSVSTASCLYDVFAYNQLQTDICIHVRSFRHTHSCMVTDYGRVQQLTGRISRTAYVIDRSAVGQLSSLSTRTKWQRLPAGDTLRCHFVLLDRTKVVQQLTCLTQAVPLARRIRPVSC